jgi:serine/threonine-protein kinase
MRGLRPGDVLDRRYKIERLIATGGMGKVYRARRTRLGDVVAIKIVHGPGDSAMLRQRFISEARICAALRHPHIVSVLDFGIEAGIGSYLVMEHLTGPSLKQQLETRRAFDVAEVCRIAAQVASALDLAHSHGIVHGDIKPGNVMAHQYTTDEVVYKVIDFGIADLKKREATPTASGEGERMLVTLAYASPEQLNGAATDAQTDVYSLGVTLYALLAGRLPFVASDPAALMEKHRHELPDTPIKYRPDIPAEAAAAVLKALAKDPRARWERASDLAQAIAGAAAIRLPVVPASTSPLASGYEVGQLIGHGRLGSDIHDGMHRATGQRVAIRIMRRNKRNQWEAARTRFLREARMTPVNHPSILRVRDYGEERDLVYVVTDFVPGSSLREVMDGAGALPWTRGRPLLADLISATRALHTHGLLAFGMTPSLIRVTAGKDRERLVISLAGIVEPQEVLARDHSESRPERERIHGDAFYLAPELLIGEKPDGRTDIFALGVLGYELFTGRRPFEAKTYRQLLTAALSGKIEDPRNGAPSLPTEAALCLLRCLETRPDKRFADAIELETAWRRIALRSSAYEPKS